jgi:hypothetical protein
MYWGVRRTFQPRFDHPAGQRSSRAEHHLLWSPARAGIIPVGSPCPRGGVARRQWVTDGGLQGCPLRANEKSFPCQSLLQKRSSGA